MGRGGWLRRSCLPFTVELWCSKNECGWVDFNGGQTLVIERRTVSRTRKTRTGRRWGQGEEKEKRRNESRRRGASHNKNWEAGKEEPEGLEARAGGEGGKGGPAEISCGRVQDLKWPRGLDRGRYGGSAKRLPVPERRRRGGLDAVGRSGTQQPIAATLPGTVRGLSDCACRHKKRNGRATAAHRSHRRPCPRPLGWKRNGQVSGRQDGNHGTVSASASPRGQPKNSPSALSSHLSGPPPPPPLSFFSNKQMLMAGYFG